MDSKNVIRENCRQLLKKLRSRQVSEENVDFVIQQFKQHCDFITKQDVQKSVESLELKFKIHANHEKSKRFVQLVHKLIELTSPNEQTHPTWSIIYLLIKLAYRPTDSFDSKISVLENIETHLSLNVSQFQKVETKSTENGTNNENELSLPWSDTEEEDNQPAPPATNSLKAKLSDNQVQEVFPLFRPPQKRFSSQKTLNEIIQDNHSTVKPITEQQSIQQLLWALQLNQKPSSIDTTHIQELIQNLKFIHSTSFNQMLNAGYSLTYQAFFSGSIDIVADFYRSISEFENQLAKSKLTTSHFLLLVQPWKEKMAILSEIQHLLMQEYDRLDNTGRVDLLFSILIDHARNAQVENYEIIYPMLLHLLSKCLEPFLNLVEAWLNRGQLDDPYQEFGIKRNGCLSPRDERFWLDSVTISQTSKFLQPLMNDVLLGGRSVDLLFHLSVSLNNDVQFHQSLNGTFYDRFIRRFFSSTKTSDESDFNAKSDNCIKPANQMLKDCFKNMNFNRRKLVREENKVEFKTPPEFYPLSPLLEESLLEPIRHRQRFLSKRLIQVMYDTCSFRVHILNLRRIHFMQAGDLMGRFCLQLYEKAKVGEKWDNEPSLNLSLINCLSPRMKSASEYVSVSVTNPSRLQINYKVPWPINLVITQESLKLYNCVLSFLLEIKQSIITLQRLSFKELNNIEDKLTLHRSHRLQLLRAWLLHFVSSVDNYIMECVMEPSHDQFDCQLKTAQHLGEIINYHQEYVHRIHKQCLQEPSGAFLRNPILEVFEIASEVASAWVNGIDLERLTELEENYVRRHQFVASVLGTGASHAMLPYVETLAAALIHSCPATQHHN